MNLQVGVKVLIEREGKYLFLRRSKLFQGGAQNWDIPGGRIEPSESHADPYLKEVLLNQRSENG